MERKVYNVTNLTPGNHTLIVEPTGGCSASICYKNMSYAFVVDD